jgi:hypothetical protein
MDTSTQVIFFYVTPHPLCVLSISEERPGWAMWKAIPLLLEANPPSEHCSGNDDDMELRETHLTNT